MWRIPLPDIGAGENYDKCIERVRNPALKAQLESIRSLIVSAESDYSNKAQIGELYNFPEESFIGGVSGTELIKTYTNRMVQKGQPGRENYSKLKSLAIGDVCPFCGHRNVSTLDHILPKANYPVLSVTPMNLVACCSDCNDIKDSFTPTSEEDCVLHPYFDNLDDAQWLVAEVYETSPASIGYGVSYVTTWTTTKNIRIAKQFELLELDSLYMSQAAAELTDIRHNLQRHYDAGGASAVRSELIFQWESRKSNRVNSWSTACYQAMANSDWFCNGGYSYL